MSGVGQPERATKNRIIALFFDELGYHYLGHWITRDWLGEKLGEGLGETLAAIVQALWYFQ